MADAVTNPAGVRVFDGRQRRLCPRLWDPDYCLLRGLRQAVEHFAAGVPAGARIVDYGCGEKPYQSLFPRCEYIGVDIGDNPRADVLCVPGKPVPLPDACADAIISVQVVYKIPEFSFYLDECRRMLKPGGQLLLSTHGTWTYHPATGGDFYRFTRDGVRMILEHSGFELLELSAVVGTLGTGLHLRQLIFNSWLSKLHLKPLCAPLNVLTNLRILLEDKLTPPETRKSSPTILVAVARKPEVK